MSAGGPKISCQKNGGDHEENQLNELNQLIQLGLPDQLTEFDSFYRSMQSETLLSSDAAYVPMD